MSSATSNVTDDSVLYAEHPVNAGDASSPQVAVLTLNRPQNLNSFTRAMHQQLWAALDKAEANAAVRAVVITGAGRGFCAGADLSEFDFTPGDDLVERANPSPVIEACFNPTARRMAALRVPSVAAVNSVAAGAGVSLAMGCDMAIAAPTASFIQAFSKIGLIPDAGGTWHLPRVLGTARAMGLALTGDKLLAPQAKEWGLIWDVADDPLAAALVLAKRLATMPTQALVRTRQLLHRSGMNTLDEQLKAELNAQSDLGRTHDYIEGVSAFLQKRPAVFTGK